MYIIYIYIYNLQGEKKLHTPEAELPIFFVAEPAPPPVAGLPGVAVRDLGTAGADKLVREFVTEDEFVNKIVAEDEFVRAFMAEFVAEADEELGTEFAGVEEDAAYVRGRREGGREGGEGERVRVRETVPQVT
jgi:hypothetical protein